MLFQVNQNAVTDAAKDFTQVAYNPIENLIQSIIQSVGNWTPKILGAIVALFIGLWIVNFLTGVFRKAISKSRIEPTLVPFLSSVVGFTLKAILFLGVSQMLGFEITSIAAILVGVGAAIGGAFNGSLGNIASGIMILFFRPFKINDLIELPDGSFGFVREISLFVTTLETFERKTVIIANSSITANKITNYTTIGNLRVDIPFGIQYGSDLAKAKEIVMNVMASDANILQDPKPNVVVNNLGENGVELLALPYADCAKFWDVFWGTREQILIELGKAGFEAPLPQRIIRNK
jgi:small conductance mechanosensitive channel